MYATNEGYFHKCIPLLLLILQDHSSCGDMTEIETKVKYVKLARSLRTYGVTFFLVKVLGIRYTNNKENKLSHFEREIITLLAVFLVIVNTSHICPRKRENLEQVCVPSCKGPGLGLVYVFGLFWVLRLLAADHIRVRLLRSGYGNVLVPPGLPVPFMSRRTLGQHIGLSKSFLLLCSLTGRCLLRIKSSLKS